MLKHRRHHRPYLQQQGSTTIPIDADPVVITGTVTIPAMPGGGGGRGLDAVDDLGMDPTGHRDCSEILQDYLDDSTLSYNSELHFPPGRYYFASEIVTNAKNVRLIGDGNLANMGDAAVVFSTDQPLAALLWWNPPGSSNMNGPLIENIQFQDSSPDHNALKSVIRLTSTANSELKVCFQNLRSQRYTNGTVSVVSQSKTVAGRGTYWQHDIEPAWIVIGGYPYEVAQVDSPVQLTLAIAYQGPTASNQPYGLNWGGIGVLLEPGNDFTQYGKDWALNGRCGCALFARAGTGATGTSRIKIKSGYLNGESVPDSMCCYLGPFSDTFQFDVSMNSYAFCVVVANGHQHDLQHLDCENAGPPPGVSGMPVSHDSCYGVLVMSSNGSDCYGNRIGGYFRQIGTAIELYGQPGHAPDHTVIGVSTFRSNKANFVNGSATNTIGAGTYASSSEWHEPPPNDDDARHTDMRALR